MWRKLERIGKIEFTFRLIQNLSRPTWDINSNFMRFTIPNFLIKRLSLNVQLHQQCSSTLDPKLWGLFSRFQINWEHVTWIFGSSLSNGIDVTRTFVQTSYLLLPVLHWFEQYHWHWPGELHGFWGYQTVLLDIPFGTFKEEPFNICSWWRGCSYLFLFYTLYIELPNKLVYWALLSRSCLLLQCGSEASWEGKSWDPEDCGGATVCPGIKLLNT